MDVELVFCPKIFCRRAQNSGLRLGTTSGPWEHPRPQTPPDPGSRSSARGAGSLGRGVFGLPFSFSSLSHFPFPPVPSRPPSPGPGGRASRRVPSASPRTKRRRIPAGPRSAKSEAQDGKLQKSSPLCPPPRLSRNSRPSALAPQLIHSPGAGVSQHVRPASTPSSALAPPSPLRTRPGSRSPSPAG